VHSGRPLGAERIIFRGPANLDPLGTRGMAGRLAAGRVVTNLPTRMMRADDVPARVMGHGTQIRDRRTLRVVKSWAAGAYSKR
jgi:hypothetical protein